MTTAVKYSAANMFSRFLFRPWGFFLFAILLVQSAPPSIAATAPASPLTKFPGAWWDVGRVGGILKVYTDMVGYRHHNLRHPYPKSVTDCFKLLSSNSGDRKAVKRCKIITGDAFRVRANKVRKMCRKQPTHERSMKGFCNDVNNHWAGSKYYRFGRNVPPPSTPRDIHGPDPVKVAKLFDRKSFVPAEIVNLLGVGWIQFMIHDWVHHSNVKRGPTVNVWSNTTGRRIAIKATKTARGDESETENKVTHWWDASQLYGSELKVANSLRSFEKGHLKLNEYGDLLRGKRGLPKAGITSNWWVGLHLMHLIFTKEHNAVADHFAKLHPSWDDERLYQQARLVISALIANRHVLEWTKAILRHRVVHLGLDYNWYGSTIEKFFGAHNVKLVERLTMNRFPKVLPGAIRGKPVDHGVPFCLTEEFVSIYRMHSLLPDSIKLRSHSTQNVIKERTLFDLSLKKTIKTLKDDGIDNMIFSFGVESAGALVLHNYPRLLRNLKIRETSKHAMDMAVVDILRDRERRIPRYNDVRRALKLPLPKTFLELCGNDAKLAAEMAEVYNNNLEDVDLIVGCHAEQPRPTGFGFSDTAFRIFSFMARRRLETDRFFTTDFREEVYTREGLEWVEKTTMKDILLRHWPQLEKALKGVNNVFAPWDKAALQTPLDFTEPWN